MPQQDSEELAHIVERIHDPRLRYFYFMLGSALADCCDNQLRPNHDAPEQRPMPVVRSR